MREFVCNCQLYLRSVVGMQGFHSEAITGLDVCQRKPLAVTSSTDKCIRVWNYLEKTCELAKYFPQEALSISLHPSGVCLLPQFISTRL